MPKMSRSDNPFTLPLYKDAALGGILHPITDTHCHLDYLKSDTLDNIIAKAGHVGVHRLITISVSPDNHQQVLCIANQYPQVFCTQGIHPHHAKDSNPAAIQAIKNNLKHKKVVAVGEIGLDFHYNLSDKKSQLDVFAQHLQMAVDHNMPVVIHSRDADDEMQAMLKNFDGKIKGVIHSFTSSLQLAKAALDQGLMLGLNGIITFKNAQNVRDVLLYAPLDRILIETDSPFLSPVPLRGQENTPANVPWVAAHALKLKNVDVLQFLKQIEMNAEELFRFNR